MEIIHSDDTIVAISTAAGKGGIGIIRLSGKDALKIGLKIFQAKDLKDGIKAKQAYFGHVHDKKGDQIDRGYLIYFKKPLSFTGEDTIEISCHGSPQILKRVVEEAITTGARLAAPGEFTMRAFFNGKIDLIQAEALKDLIEAKTAFQAKVAYHQLEGKLSKAIIPVKGKLIDLIVEAETSLDFPEEEVPISYEKIKEELKSLCLYMRKLTSSYKEGKTIREGATVGIVGLPNVGKSSIFNQLLRYDRAIVTEVPGTTRDTLEEYVDLLGIPVKLVDTAGLRDGRGIIEKEGVRRSRKIMKRADILLLVLDSSRPMLEEERKFFQECHPERTIIVINKIDLERKMDERWIPSRFRKRKKISAKTGRNMTQLNDLIRKTLSRLGEEIAHEAIVTNVRHGELLKKALKSMRKTVQAFNEGLSLEFALSDMRKALSFLGELTGEVTIDDIYERIFSKFCLGK